MVVNTSRCPRSSWTVRMSWPSSSRWVAKEWRNVWQPGPLAPRVGVLLRESPPELDAVGAGLDGFALGDRASLADRERRRPRFAWPAGYLTGPLARGVTMPVPPCASPSTITCSFVANNAARPHRIRYSHGVWRQRAQLHRANETGQSFTGVNSGVYMSVSSRRVLRTPSSSSVSCMNFMASRSMRPSAESSGRISS